MTTSTLPDIINTLQNGEFILLKDDNSPETTVSLIAIAQLMTPEKLSDLKLHK